MLARPLPSLSRLTLWVVCCVACHSTPESSEGVELSVYAASSLADAFSTLEAKFEAVHPGVDVRVSYAGSQVLKLQLEHGAMADVFASANPSHMETLISAGLVSESSTFAKNELVVAVPTGNPARIGAFEELNRATRLVTGTRNTPVGIYARKMLERARRRLGDPFVAEVESHIVSEESNVRLVRAKVVLGEADAAIIYRTDATSSPKLETVAIPGDINVEASYAIGVVARSKHPDTARAFVDFVRSKDGEDALTRQGFLPVMP